MEPRTVTAASPKTTAIVAASFGSSSRALSPLPTRDTPSALSHFVEGARVSTPNLLAVEHHQDSHLRKKRRLPTRVELRHHALSTSPALRLPSDSAIAEVVSTKHRLAALPAPNPSVIEAELNEDLLKLTSKDRYRQLHAHRLALEKYILLQDPTSQHLLRRILTCYEEVELHQFTQHFEDITRRLEASEVVARDALHERNALRQHAESLRLDILNLERMVRAKDEMLSEIATTHRINLATVNWIDGGDAEQAGGAATQGHSKRSASRAETQRTMAQIRSIQERVALRHGEAVKQTEREERLAAKHDDAEARAELETADALLSRGLPTLAGVAANELHLKAAEADLLAMQTNNMGDIYRHSQRIENVGVMLRAHEAPEGTNTALPGRSPRLSTATRGEGAGD